MKTYTFKSTGATVLVPPISQVAMGTELLREFPTPRPPRVAVEIGNETYVEENYAHPDYAKAIERHNNFVAGQTMMRILAKIAAVQKIGDDERAVVAEHREAFEGIQELHKNDKFVWFYKIALGEDEEINEMIRLATGQADPTPEGVGLEQDNFRGELSRNGDLSASDASVGHTVR